MFDNNLAYVNKQFSNKFEVINFLCKKAYEAGKLTEIKKFECSVLKREDEFSTAIGYEVAIPHGSSDTVNESFVAVATLKENMKWGEEKVKMIFMIGVPESKRTMEHLKILAWLSKNLMHEDFREKIVHAEDESQLYSYLKDLEKIGG